MNLISVIVPVYNGEKYLHRCVDSILSQTYKNLEILLIDDGSKDNSASICDEYAEKDNRIVVIHKKNEGTGPTRQYGMEHAHGEYIAFVDNDDYIVPDMYEKMMKAIEESGADYCACQFNYEYADGTHLYTTFDRNPALMGLHDSVPFSHFLFNQGGYANGVVCSIWNKLFRRDLLKGLQSKNGRGEEEEVNDYVNRNNVKVIVIPDECYYWCENFQSVTHSGFKEINFHFLEILEQRSRWFKGDEYMVRESQKLFCNMFIEYYFHGKENNVETPAHLGKIFRRFVWELTQVRYSEWKFYLRMFLFMVSPSLYQTLFLRK